MPDNDGNETFMEKLYRKCSKEPLVPIGSIATLACLGAGLRAFHSGQKFKAQQLMRVRVLAQGFTVMVMMIGAYTGFKPHDRPATFEEKMERNNKIESK